MRKRRLLSVRLADTASRDGLERFLREQPGVRIPHEAGDRIQFEFDGGDEDQVRLVGRIVGAGFPVLEFSAHGAGLEDLFIEITGGRTS